MYSVWWDETLPNLMLQNNQINNKDIRQARWIFISVQSSPVQEDEEKIKSVRAWFIMQIVRYLGERSTAPCLVSWNDLASVVEIMIFSQFWRRINLSNDVLQSFINWWHYYFSIQLSVYQFITEQYLTDIRLSPHPGEQSGVPISLQRSEYNTLLSSSMQFVTFSTRTFQALWSQTFLSQTTCRLT